MKKREAIFCAVSSALILLSGVGCARSPQRREAAALQRGQALMAKRDYSRAQLEFRNAVQAMPKDAEAYYQLALAYLGSSNVAGAIAALRKAIELNPGHQGAQLKMAELMTASRNKDLIEEAAGKLRDLVAARPDNLEAIDTLATAEFQLGQTDAAGRRLEELLEKIPTHLQSSVVLARLRLRQRDFDGAQAVLLKAVASAPQSAAAALALGQLYLIRGQADKAEAEIRRAVALDPKTPDALMGLAILQMGQQKLADAEQTYRRLSELPDPRYRPLHAAFLYRTGQKDAALAEFRKLAEQAPDDAAARTRLIALYLDMNRIADAQNLLHKALERNPRDMDALLQRSRLYLKSNRLDEAAQDLRQVLQLKPDSVDAHYILSFVYRAQGLQAMCKQELDSVLRLKPSFLAARTALAGDYLLANQPQSALNLLDEAPGSQKNMLNTIVMRNWALMASGNLQQARTSLNQLLENHRSPDLVLQDALLRMQERDYPGARADAEEVLRSNPADARAARVVADSYEQQKEPGKALERLKELAGAQLKSAQLQFLLGQWQMRAGNLGEAQKALEAAVAADPGFGNAELGLAEIEMRQKRFDAARQRLLALTKANPKDSAAMLQLASLEEQSGNRDEAIRAYRAVLAADSGNIFALNNLAYVLAIQDPDEALKFAEQAAEAAPDSAAIQDTLGWVYYRKGRYTAAITCLRAAVAKQPTPRRRFHLAMSYLKSGDRTAGQLLMQAALKADPTLPETEHAWQ